MLTGIVKIHSSPLPPVGPKADPELRRTSGALGQAFPAASKQSLKTRLLTTTANVADLARLVELDETAYMLLGPGHDGFVQGMSTIDGVVTAYDGYRLFREGTEDGHRWKHVGGGVRIGLGLAGMAPGLSGNVAEGICGLYCLVEGLATHDRINAMGGLTQMGVSAGMGAACLGMTGTLPLAVVLGSGAARVAYYLHRFNRPEGDS